MALHENFREYTKEEIDKIKLKVCIKHNCPYIGVMNDSMKNCKDVTRKICNYILYTGHMRDCMPDDCKHYKDKNVVKRRKFSDSDGTNYSE